MSVRKWSLLGAVLLVPSMGAAQNNVYVFEDIEVLGYIEKPEAFYILSPTNLEYRSLEAEESFLDRLYETVFHEPF